MPCNLAFKAAPCRLMHRPCKARHTHPSKTPGDPTLPEGPSPEGGMKDARGEELLRGPGMTPAGIKPFNEKARACMPQRPACAASYTAALSPALLPALAALMGRRFARLHCRPVACTPAPPALAMLMGCRAARLAVCCCCCCAASGGGGGSGVTNWQNGTACRARGEKF